MENLALLPIEFLRSIVMAMAFAGFQSVIFTQEDGLRVYGEIGIRGKWQIGNFAQFVINPNGNIAIEKDRIQIEVLANYEHLKVNRGSLINDFLVL